jgi:hypothetical protein
MDELRIIVGKGIHSQNHIAKIKPAVEDLMVKYVPVSSLARLSSPFTHVFLLESKVRTVCSCRSGEYGSDHRGYARKGDLRTIEGCGCGGRRDAREDGWGLCDHVDALPRT